MHFSGHILFAECGEHADAFGIHALSCVKSRARHARHRQLNNLISLGLTSAVIPNQLEPPGMSRDDGKRPDGVTLIPWYRGKPLVWDATCVNRLASSYRAAATAADTPIANEAENRKCSKYAGLQNNYFFCPLGFESLGGFGRCARHTIKVLGKRIEAASSDGNSARYLRERIAVAIQAGNAAAVLETFSAF